MDLVSLCILFLQDMREAKEKLKDWLNEFMYLLYRQILVIESGKKNQNAYSEDLRTV